MTTKMGLLCLFFYIYWKDQQCFGSCVEFRCGLKEYVSGAVSTFIMT